MASQRQDKKLREKHFRYELKCLLARTQAEIVIKMDSNDMPYIEIIMDAIYDDDDTGDELAEYTEFEL